MQTMERTEVVIDGVSLLLAQEQDLDDLIQRFEAAANGPARFVEFVVVGNRRMRVLITPGARIMISTTSVPYDPRDTGDESAPWGGMFDLETGVL